MLRFYRTTLIPTESVVHTALANSGPLSLSRDYRRYSVWDDPHMIGPRVLRLPDLDTMLSSGADIARKFDESVDAEVLDEVDRLVHSRWGAQPVAVAPATAIRSIDEQA